MFDEKRSWITKYMPFSVFLLMIRYKWKIYKCKTNRLTSHRFIMGTMWGQYEVLKIARQHSIEAALPDRGETTVMAQTKLEEQQKDKLVERLKVSSGLVERKKELGISDLKIKLQYKRNVPEAEFPTQVGYSGFQVTEMIEWSQKSRPKKIPEPKLTPKKSHADFVALQSSRKG